MKLNHIYCMDNVEGLRKHVTDESIDLTVTSPPYDNLRKYNGFEWDFESLAHELYRVTKPGGVVVWVVGDATINGSETLTSFKQAIYFKEVVGFNVHDTMIFEKDSIRYPEANRYYSAFEYMFIFSKGKPKTFNPIRDRKNKRAGELITGRDRNPDGSLKRKSGHGKRKVPEYGIRFNVWKYQIGKWKVAKDKEAYKHPAIFPEKLAEDHIISWSNPGDIVLDPFMGSGTTAKMAALNGRFFVGFEISEEYVEIANKRLEGLK